MVEHMPDASEMFGRPQEVGDRPGHEERYAVSPGRFGAIRYVVGFFLVGLGCVMLVPALVPPIRSGTSCWGLRAPSRS